MTFWDAFTADPVFALKVIALTVAGICVTVLAWRIAYYQYWLWRARRAAQRIIRVEDWRSQMRRRRWPRRTLIEQMRAMWPQGR